MNRYQIYLNSQSVATYDRAAEAFNLNRSRIMRDVLDRVALELRKALVINSRASVKKNPILMMSGIGKSSTGRIAEDVDSIYLRD